MEEPESITTFEDSFLDASDEFPFYDCVGTTEPIPIPDLGISGTSPEISPLRRRRPFVKDSVISYVSTSNTSAASTLVPRVGRYGFSRKMVENEGKKEKLKSSRLGSENTDDMTEIESSEEEMETSMDRLTSVYTDNFKEDDLENSTVTTEEDAGIEYTSTLDSQPGLVDDSSSSNLLLLLAGLVVKAITFQMNLLVKFMTFPIKVMHGSCMFIIDPCGAARRIRRSIKQKLVRVWTAVFEILSPLIYKWLKEQKSLWMLALQIGWGFLWSIYVGFVLVTLLVSSFLMSGMVMSLLVSEPIQMKEILNFDYTENSPVAYVPIISCSALYCGDDCIQETENDLFGAKNWIIPRHQKVKVTVSLTLPESNYNRNLGNFQVKVDFLSINGKTLESSRRSCMLNFRSEPIRILTTLFNIAPLITGYSLESQTLNMYFNGFTEKNIPTSCVRVTVEQRAEFRPSSGIPEIYSASLALESELPFLKKILWNWKTTILIWFSMTVFCLELLFTLLCCKSIVIPRTRLRRGSSEANAPQNSARIRSS